MIRAPILLLFAFFLLSNAFAQYFPPKGNWERATPASLGIDIGKLNRAISFAQANEYRGSRDLKIAILESFGREPYHDLLGPVKERGGPTGLIIKNGYIIGEWGEPDRVEMTFSVTKSYLSTVAGLAVDDRLLTLPDPVSNYVWDGTFDGVHNSSITWHHLLNQSSDWSGTLFDLEDWADRPPKEGNIDDWKRRKLNKPGTVFEYNDVRVNVLAYSLLQVWRTPLPKVLKERIMDPVGASTTWRWYGYDHSWTFVDGIQMQSVTGGGHSGGGMFVNTYDQARFGLLFLNEGSWNGEQLISKDWVKMVQEPSEANTSYGYMWWLNKGPRKWWEVASEKIYYAAGFGGNFIIVNTSNNLLIVTRWLDPDRVGEMVKLVLESLDRNE